MYVILVKVQSAQGVDTQYLFPGIAAHWSVAISSVYSGAAYGVVYNSVNGQNYTLSVDSGSHPGSVNGLTITDGGHDVSGTIAGWGLVTNDLTTALLATVGFFDITTPHPVALASMIAASPDTLISQAYSRGDGAYMNLVGNDGNDTLRGSSFSDDLDGGKGKDLMIGGDGNDTYHIDNSGDRIVDTGGNLDALYSSVSYTAPSGIEYMYAVANGHSGLHLTGNSGRNWIEGGDHGDTLKGMTGDDALLGNGGKDTLYGGDGNDTFRFVSGPTASAADTIMDFKTGHDHLEYYSILFRGVFAASVSYHTVLPSKAFWASTSGKAHDSSDRILYDKDDGKLYYDADGTGRAHARVQFETLYHHPTLHNTDFWFN